MLPENATDSSIRARFLRHWRPTAAIAAAVIVVGAFLLWGPIGLGNGPLNMGRGGLVVGGEAQPGQQRVAFIIPASNSWRSSAVVDSVRFIGSDRFPLPGPTSFWAIPFSNCDEWQVATMRGEPNLEGACGVHELGPLIGRGFGYDKSGGGAMGLAVAAVPSPTGCWVIAKVVVHYHVGIRHYAATDPFGFDFCGAQAPSALRRAADQAAIDGSAAP